MYYLERLDRREGVRPAFWWRRMYYCPERWPLALMLKHLDRNRYRITKSVK